MSFHLNGKTALVTGAGRGIGRAIATQLAGAGASVMINDIDPGVLTEAQASVGQNCKSWAGDLTATDAAQKLVAETIAQFGAIDIIVNNAGYTWDNVIQKMTDEQFQAMLDIHIVAPFRVLRAASEYIRGAAKKESAGGNRVMRKVVNISSISGTDGNAGQAGYSSGKAAIVGLTKTMAKEWGRYNVNVNAVAFGMIETRLIQPLAGESASIDMKGRKIPVGVQQKMLDAAKTMCPLGRLGTADEAAGAVMFFCSPLSDYVSGEVLIVSGGAHF